MQGESDRHDTEKYSHLFKLFIEDIRRDLGEITQEDLSDMAIMIGEISRTFSDAYPETIAYNERFIEMQRQIADDCENVYAIPSSQYDINKLEGNTSVPLNGSYNSAHWDMVSMFKIGELVGRCITDNI